MKIVDQVIKHKDVNFSPHCCMSVRKSDFHLLQFTNQ